MGQIQGVIVVILVDSWSSHLFINESIAPTLEECHSNGNYNQSSDANGQVVCCNSEAKQATWVLQDHEFTLDFNVISLPYYDMILGID
jgi:hypothetical protein